MRHQAAGQHLADRSTQALNLAAGPVHRLPHVDARRQLHLVQRLLSVGWRAGVGAAGHAGRAADVPGRRRLQGLHPALAGDHDLLRQSLDERRPHRRWRRWAARATTPTRQPGLAWIDLENASALPSGQNPFTVLKGTAWNWIYPPTAGKYAAAPSWSHLPANDFIVFTATSNVKSGRLGTGTAHLYQVPYSKTAPQSATPNPGARRRDQPQIRAVLRHAVVRRRVHRLRPGGRGGRGQHPPGPEHRRTPDAGTCTWDGMYMQPAAELYVTPTVRRSRHPPGRERSRQLPRAAGQRGDRSTTPGPSGRPRSRRTTGTTYYWLIFSSWRQGDKDGTGEPIAQLFMTVIVKPDGGPLQTYPAVYLWNQPPNVSNFTPAWDVFKIGNVG